jgi:putative membrane protein
VNVHVAREWNSPGRDGIGPNAVPALASAAAVLLAGIPLALLHALGPLSWHMALHILSMNVVAPLAAAMVVRRRAARAIPATFLWTFTAAQMLALWFLHTPRFHALAAHAPAISLAVQGLLAGLALGFWIATLRLGVRQRWHAPAALLLTAKLACLMAAFLIFSPRVLYAAHAHAAPVGLADQQLAGLLMIVTCPLSYLTAAVLCTLDLIGPQATDAGKLPRHARS